MILVRKSCFRNKDLIVGLTFMILSQRFGVVSNVYSSGSHLSRFTFVRFWASDPMRWVHNFDVLDQRFDYAVDMYDDASKL